MKRPILTVAQIIVALAMVPTAFVCLPSVVGTFAYFEFLLIGAPHVSPGTDWPYFWAIFVQCLFADLAPILAFISAALLVAEYLRLGRGNSHRAARLSLAGALCYWGFVAGVLVTGLTLKEPGESIGEALWVMMDRAWFQTLLLAVAASLTAWGLRSLRRRDEADARTEHTNN